MISAWESKLRATERDEIAAAVMRSHAAANVAKCVVLEKLS